MSKKINLNSFKTVAVALFAFVALLPSHIAWGQNPCQGFIVVPVRMLVHQTIGSFYENVSVAVPCPLWDPNQNPWNGVNTTKVNPITGQTVRLENMDTNNLTFPTQGISAADVERFFDMVYLSAGYTRSNLILGATLNMNCHGYSTWMAEWLNDFDKKIAHDYTPETIAEHLGKVGVINNDIIFAINGHSIRATTTARLVNGEIEYEIIRTREKFNASAIYLKEINHSYTMTNPVSVGMTSGMNATGTHTTATVGYYWYPKK